MAHHIPRTRNIFDASSQGPYRLSRSKLEYFLECPRCFYLDRRLGLARPEGPPFTLNLAVDFLLKREFDLCRGRGESHPLMQQYGIDAVPLVHAELEEWRDATRGIAFLHEPTRFLFFGAVDDVWASPDGELIIVDYKATSTYSIVTLDTHWKQAYKRQLEMYQWLFRKNGFRVSDTGYFVYVNAEKGRESFDGRLEFKTTILPYKGDASWVEDALMEAWHCLSQQKLPSPNADCAYCGYRSLCQSVEV